MLYPKIPRKSLALLLVCLVFTLAAVGIMFIIYLCYTNSTMFAKPLFAKIYSESYHHLRYHQQATNHQMPEQLRTNSIANIESPSYPMHSNNNNKIQNLKPNQNNNKKTIFTQPNSDEDSTHETEEISDENFNNNFYTNSDTIYIDDYDRISDKVDTNQKIEDDITDINNIDDFTSILMDHKKILQFTNNNKKRTKLHRQLTSNVKHKGSIILSENFTNDNNRKHKTIINKQQLSDTNEEIFDNDTIGSGSGDFIDDTETEIDENLTNIEHKIKKQNRKIPKYPRIIDNRSENFYSVSSEFISNLSNQSSITSTISSSSSSSSSVSPSSLLLKLEQFSTIPLGTTSPNPMEEEIDIRNNNRINKLERQRQQQELQQKLRQQQQTGNNKKWIPPSVLSSREMIITTNQTPDHQNGAWLETRARRIMGNVKKSEERSRQLLLCAEAGGGELCRMLFKGHLTE